MFLSMAQFFYKNVKNTNSGYISFKLNLNFLLKVLYKEDVNLCSKSRAADVLRAQRKK